jgi:hypothetical protein
MVAMLVLTAGVRRARGVARRQVLVFAQLLACGNSTTTNPVAALCRCARVSKSWRDVVLHDALWQPIFRAGFGRGRLAAAQEAAGHSIGGGVCGGRGLRGDDGSPHGSPSCLTAPSSSSSSSSCVASSLSSVQGGEWRRRYGAAHRHAAEVGISTAELVQQHWSFRFKHDMSLSFAVRKHARPPARTPTRKHAQTRGRESTRSGRLPTTEADSRWFSRALLLQSEARERALCCGVATFRSDGTFCTSLPGAPSQRRPLRYFLCVQPGQRALRSRQQQQQHSGAASDGTAGAGVAAGAEGEPSSDGSQSQCQCQGQGQYARFVQVGAFPTLAVSRTADLRWRLESDIVLLLSHPPPAALMTAEEETHVAR